MSFLLAFLAMLTIVAAMAVGVIFGRQPIRGSCGGLGALGIDAECEICGGSTTRCAESRTGDDARNPVRGFDPRTGSKRRLRQND